MVGDKRSAGSSPGAGSSAKRVKLEGSREQQAEAERPGPGAGGDLPAALAGLADLGPRIFSLGSALRDKNFSSFKEVARERARLAAELREASRALDESCTIQVRVVVTAGNGEEVFEARGLRVGFGEAGDGAKEEEAGGSVEKTVRTVQEMFLAALEEKRRAFERLKRERLQELFDKCCPRAVRLTGGLGHLGICKRVAVGERVRATVEYRETVNGENEWRCETVPGTFVVRFADATVSRAEDDPGAHVRRNVLGDPYVLFMPDRAEPERDLAMCAAINAFQPCYPDKAFPTTLCIAPPEPRRPDTLCYKGSQVDLDICEWRHVDGSFFPSGDFKFDFPFDEACPGVPPSSFEFVGGVATAARVYNKLKFFRRVKEAADRFVSVPTRGGAGVRPVPSPFLERPPGSRLPPWSVKTLDVLTDGRSNAIIEDSAAPQDIALTEIEKKFVCGELVPEQLCVVPYACPDTDNPGEMGEKKLLDLLEEDDVDWDADGSAVLRLHLMVSPCEDPGEVESISSEEESEAFVANSDEEEDDLGQGAEDAGHVGDDAGQGGDDNAEQGRGE